MFATKKGVFMSIKELLEQRRSYRKFDQSKKISKEDIQDILESVRYASCGNNRQFIRYLSIEGEEKVEEVFSITKWAASLPPEVGQPKEGEHPVYFVALVYDPKKVGPFHGIDQGLAISNMTLAAYEKGIGSCIIANFDRKKFREIISYDENFACDILVAFGYPSIQSHIKDISKDEDPSYYLDEKGNYVVPKYQIADLVETIK